MIAVNGKGGTGKSTVSALIIKHLAAEKAGSVLAIDADPNSNLPELLGVKDAGTVVGVVDYVSKNMDKMPAGVTKDRFIEMKVQESLAEEDGFDLLVMGRPEGPGCYCYVNNLLRGITQDIARDYDIIVIDNAAGMEHISRRTTTTIDKLLLVSDHSIFGIRSAARIWELVKSLGLAVKDPYLVLNKVSGGADDLMPEINASGMKLAGTIPYDINIQKASLTGGTIFDVNEDNVRAAMENLLKMIAKDDEI